MKWQKKLTKKELKHLKETNAMTLASFRLNFAQHQAWRAEGRSEPCWTCRTIARKLGWLE